MYISKINPQIVSRLSELSAISDVRGVFQPMLKDNEVVYVLESGTEFEMASIDDSREEGGYVRITGDVTYGSGQKIGACSTDTICSADMVFVAWSRKRPSANFLDVCIHAANKLKVSVADVYNFETTLKKSSNNPHGIIASEFNILHPQMGLLSICKVEFSIKYSVSCQSTPTIENC